MTGAALERARPSCRGSSTSGFWCMRRSTSASISTRTASLPREQGRTSAGQLRLTPPNPGHINTNINCTRLHIAKSTQISRTTKINISRTTKININCKNLCTRLCNERDETHRVLSVVAVFADIWTPDTPSMSPAGSPTETAPANDDPDVLQFLGLDDDDPTSLSSTPIHRRRCKDLTWEGNTWGFSADERVNVF